MSDENRPTWGGLFDRLAGLVDDGIKLLVDPDEPHQAADGPRETADPYVGMRLETPADFDALPAGTIIRAERHRSEPVSTRIVAVSNGDLQYRWASTNNANTVGTVRLIEWARVWRVAYVPAWDDE